LSKRFGFPKPFAPNVCAPDSTTSSCVLPMASPPLLSIVREKSSYPELSKSLWNKKPALKVTQTFFLLQSSKLKWLNNT
jgi:hypothetical protein